MAAPRIERKRLDQVLVDRGLAPTRTRAQALIAAGLVEVDGTRASSAAQPVGERSSLRVLGRAHPWASRAGLKLEAALNEFGIDCAGRTALDAGASTGGFTDVLLARGAVRVYAVDVGRGQLDARLAADPRVTVMDETNLRHLTSVPGDRPSLITLDLSFISLRTVMPAATALAARPADVVALFKPQFELGRTAVGKGGVVRDDEATEQALRAFIAWSETELGARSEHAPAAAAVRGAKGNQEWLVHLALRGEMPSR